MKTIYWNIDNNILVMPEGSFDLSKAMKHAVHVRPRINDMDVIIAPRNTDAVSLINYDANDPEVKLVKCHWQANPYLYAKDAVDEKGEMIPGEIEMLMRL